MPFHIKTPSVIPSVGDVYYVSQKHWSSDYNDRKVFSIESDAIAVKTVTRSALIGSFSSTYTPRKLLNSTIVSE